MTFKDMTGGPVLIFGGAYSNLEAMQAVLAEAARRDIPADRIVCTGDLVAYGADPLACVELAKASRMQVVKGNCEQQLADSRPDCGCGYAPGSECDVLSRTWYAHAAATLDEPARRYMRDLPDRLDLRIGSHRFVVVHGSPSSINRFVFASTPARVKAREMANVEADGVIGGHAGLPFTQTIDGRLWHNAGAIGMPANDGTPRVWCSVLTAERDGGVTIEHVALEYDHEAAAAKMRAAGLPEGYAAALRTGLWPSCDVLPPSEAKATGKPLVPIRLSFRAGGAQDLAWPASSAAARLAPEKFIDPDWTAAGERRASVALQTLSTLWFNTGTLCNLACTHCYIESTPRNDRLAYIGADEVAAYLDEIDALELGTRSIGFTGGEPFMNPQFMTMLADVLDRGHEALVLTNAMRPMRHHRDALLQLAHRHGARLHVRVSLDHYTRDLHELERGAGSWQPTIEGLTWLSDNHIRLDVAGRLYSGESESIVRAGYSALFADLRVDIDAHDPDALVLFPEMDATLDVPEITDACWGLLGKRPADVMCASSRMVVKRKGAETPRVVACTLLAYDERFELGTTLADAAPRVALNHPHCAKFCVLGGAACSR